MYNDLFQAYMNRDSIVLTVRKELLSSVNQNFNEDHFVKKHELYNYIQLIQSNKNGKLFTKVN
jgi:hypothetical protein